MVTHSRKAKVSGLDNKIGILRENGVECPRAQPIFRAVTAILGLVRDKMNDNESALKLSEKCFDTCERLKAPISGMNTDNISGHVSIALEDLERIMRRIERTLKRVASTPHTGYDKRRVDGEMLKVQQILSSLGAPDPRPDENSTVESVGCLPANQSHGDTTAASSTENIPLPDADSPPCQHPSKRTFRPEELPSTVEAIISGEDEGNFIPGLSKDNAQIFADIMHETLETLDFSPQVRKRYLKVLYRTCGRHDILPKSFHIPPCCDQQGPLYHGGFADVWKGEHLGKNVAVKIVRIPSHKCLEKLVGKFCKEVVTWKYLRHPNVLPLLGVTMTKFQFAMVSEWMENGNIKEFLENNPDANRLGLLADAARGLIYIHNQEMVHGDLKGANILIDQTHHARVADFSLLTLVSDPGSQMSSNSHSQAGSTRWMSPELIDPERFNIDKARPTKSSDCYAFGMVMYETMSGQIPFHEVSNAPTIFMRVLDGKRPTRGDVFTDDLWEIMERCWTAQPEGRPHIEDILQYLDSLSPPPEPLSETPSPEIIGEEPGDSLETVTLPLIGWDSYRPGSWSYFDLCTQKKCPICGLGDHDDWKYCPKHLASTEARVTVFHVETARDDPFSPCQIVHRSWIRP